MAKNKINFNLINTLNERVTKDWDEEKDHAIKKHTHRANIGLAQVGRILSEEMKKKLSISSTRALTGRTLSAEHRQHISDAQKGKTVSDKTKKRASEVHKGRIISEEHRKKISETKRLRNSLKPPKPLSEQHKRNIGLAGKGKKKTEETKKRISEAHRKLAEDPAHKEKLLQLAKNATKARLSKLSSKGETK